MNKSRNNVPKAHRNECFAVTLASPSPVIAFMTYVAPGGCLAAKFDSCNSLLSSVYTLLVNILRCVRLYIKRKYYDIINYKSLRL